MKEKKERVIDAVAATKAAIEEGIVSGGEIALLRALKALDKVKTTEDEEQLGVEIVRKAVEQPLRRLLQNAGLDAEVLLKKILKETGNMGVDVTDGKIKDLVKGGVIDPEKVTRSALKNAASVAIMIMTTNVLISEKAEPASPAMPQGMPGMGEY